MNAIDQRKLSYDLAQKVDENMDNLARCKGWTEVVIPELEQVAKEAQASVLNYKTPENETNYNRGRLEVVDLLLNLIEEKKKSAKHNMVSNSIASLQ